jgi:hypothetical protein
MAARPKWTARFYQAIALEKFFSTSEDETRSLDRSHLRDTGTKPTG